MSSSPPSKPTTTLVQAAGHGTLRIDPDREDAIIKPTTRQECVSYECFTHDKETMANFLQFLPRYHTSWPIENYVVGTKFTHEVCLQNLCQMSDESVFRRKKLLVLKKKDAATTANPRFIEKEYSSESNNVNDLGGLTRLIYQSTPSVLDLKIGRFRHTNSTPLRKYMRMWRKDGPTTSRSVGMRLCGVKHSRFITDSLLNNDDEEEKDGEISSDEIRNLKREKRLAAIRNRTEKAVKAGESDSEIMQLPRAAAEQAQKQKQQQQQEENANESSSSILLDFISWSEDKVLGRSATAEELVEILAMFCTIHIDENAKVGRSPVCPEDKSAAQRFDPHPDDSLLEYFLARVNKMIEVLEKDKVLEHYSFASTSILFLHRWKISEIIDNVDANKKNDDGDAEKKFLLEIEADFRLVDFSSSGPINDELKHLGTAFNPKLRTADEGVKNNNTEDNSDDKNGKQESEKVFVNPFATHKPQKEMVKMYSDDAIEFNFGLDNVKNSLENLMLVNRILKSRSEGN